MRNYRETLETERLILRPHTPDDFEAAYSWGSNSENTRYMAWGPNNKDQTREWLSRTKPGKDFAAVLKETGAVIGSCGIYPKDDNHMADLGWILHKDYWKRGYGTELGGALIRYGFEDLKLGRIQAPCAAVNYGSYRVMERNGMRREALCRKAFWARVDKEWIDEAWYAILAEDYHASVFENLDAKESDALNKKLAEPMDIDEYITAQSENVRPLLQKIRETIRSAAPDAIEKISWRMPTFWQGENICHFAVQKKHIGFYPGGEAVGEFTARLASYKTSKGTIQFPLDKPIDYALIADIVKWRLR